MTARPRDMLVDTGTFIAGTTGLNAAETGALGLLMCAAWVAPNRALKDDDRTLARICRMTLRTWVKAKDRILEGWACTEAGWRINHAFIFTGERQTIAPSLRARILSAGMCAYCETTDGPFEVDHFYPHARGGSIEAENLVCACVPCNRRKRDHVSKEWGNE